MSLDKHGCGIGGNSSGDLSFNIQSTTGRQLICLSIFVEKLLDAFIQEQKN